MHPFKLNGVRRLGIETPEQKNSRLALASQLAHEKSVDKNIAEIERLQKERESMRYREEAEKKKREINEKQREKNIKELEKRGLKFI